MFSQLFVSTQDPAQRTTYWAQCGSPAAKVSFKPLFIYGYSPFHTVLHNAVGSLVISVLLMTKLNHKAMK